MSFAEKLSSLREIYNLSQQQLAETLGVSKQIVTQWESGKSTPDASIITRLCELFDVTEEYLYVDNRNNIQNSPEKELKKLRHNENEGTLRIKKKKFVLAILCAIIIPSIAFYCCYGILTNSQQFSLKTLYYNITGKTILEDQTTQDNDNIGENVALSDSPVGDFIYSIDNNKVSITKYIGKSEYVKIPSIIEDCPVFEITNGAFYDSRTVKHVELSEGIVRLRSYAFSKCAYLESIYLPSSIELLEEGAFHRCIVLQSISVSPSNKYYASIDGVLFDKGITVLMLYPSDKPGVNYSVPETVTKIGIWAFQTSWYLQTIILPKNLKLIDELAFVNSKSLLSIEVPASVEKIGGSAFMNCSKLNNAKFLSSTTKVGENNNDGYVYKPSDSDGNSIDKHINDRRDLTFSGNDNLVICAPPDSDAEKYAKRNGFSFVSLNE